jgi:hypothetical protein
MDDAHITLPYGSTISFDSSSNEFRDSSEKLTHNLTKKNHKQAIKVAFISPHFFDHSIDSSSPAIF